MHILLYFKAVFLHFFVEMKHYWVSTVALCAMMLLLFSGVFVASGGLALTAQNAGYVNEQVIAYLFYYVLSMYFSYFESSIRSKVETGTIEQIIINRMRLIEIVLIEAVVQFFCTIIEGLPVFIVIFIIAKGFLKLTYRLSLCSSEPIQNSMLKQYQQEGFLYFGPAELYKVLSILNTSNIAYTRVDLIEPHFEDLYCQFTSSGGAGAT